MTRDELESSPLSQAAASLNDWSSHVEDCESFLLAQLDELDALRQTFVIREQELAEREAQLALEAEETQLRWEKLSQLRATAEQSLAQVQHEAQRLTQARAEVVTLRTQLEQARNNVPSSAGKSSKTPSRAQTKQWEAERARLEQDLAAAREQAARLTNSTLELADARRESAELRRDLLRQQHRLMMAKGHFRPEQHGQLRVLEIERECLARELDSTQQQVRELQERMAREQKLIAQERSTWTVELQKLRAAVERQAAWLTGSLNSATQSPTANETEGVGTPPLALSALLSEIEQLQAELKHEKPTKSSGSKVKNPH